MLIWIGKHRREDNGATQAQVCERCHNYVRYNLVRQHRMVSFNFIPLFAIGNKWRLECPICAHGQELVGEEIETQKRAALLTAAHAYANKGEGDTIIPVRPSLAPVRPSLATVTPECQSQAETTENDAGGQKLKLKVVGVVVAALVAVAVVCVAIIAPKNAPASSSSSSSTQAIAPSIPAQTLLPRRPARANARRRKRTQSRTAASSSALPPARGEQ